MREIGGYMELDTYRLPMLHEDAIKLNCARNCLAYLIEANHIKKIALPKYLCNSLIEICNRYDITVILYSIDIDFKPQNIDIAKDTWLYLVNYYGQLTNEYIADLHKKHNKLIVDNVQAYYQNPVSGVDTIYTCRKFFGVPDGGLLYSNVKLGRCLDRDFSYERIHHTMGRYEKSASEFYGDFKKNEESFIHSPILQMSGLTFNLLHGIDYEHVKKVRTDNFMYLHDRFKRINKLHLSVMPAGAFMYPLFIENGNTIREKLWKKKIYVPLFWNTVFELCEKKELEYDMAENLLPIPVDQRYQIEDMEYVVNVISELLAI